jgi:hypothetical protein
MQPGSAYVDPPDIFPARKSLTYLQEPLGGSRMGHFWVAYGELLRGLTTLSAGGVAALDSERRTRGSRKARFIFLFSCADERDALRETHFARLKARVPSDSLSADIRPK